LKSRLFFLIEARYLFTLKCIIYSINEWNQIINKELLPSPQGCGCKSNIASVFQQTGISVMLSGGIGEGAINVLNSHGISVIKGCTGEVDKLIEKYLNSELIDSGSVCEHHHHSGEGHSCNH
jgi:predicted Fe-Mo cluster-binding NifX family protein